MEYRLPITIVTSTIIKFLGIDWSVLCTGSVENYILTPFVLDNNTNCTYSTLQDAINAASPHDTLQVANGIYRENIALNKCLI